MLAPITVTTDFLHQHEFLNAGDILQLDCDTKCNFLLLDDANFYHYRRGNCFVYSGGRFGCYPAQIRVPYTGNWNIIIDLGGAHLEIRYSICVIKQIHLNAFSEYET